MVGGCRVRLIHPQKSQIAGKAALALSPEGAKSLGRGFLRESQDWKAMSRAAKVLIIDDDSDYLASTRALLESEGYTVVEASGGQDGLAAARKHHPDLIVLDLMMESLQEGYSVNQAIKFAPEPIWSSQ